MRSLSLTKEQLQFMVDHVNKHAPLEACGLLAGRNDRVERIFEIRNQAQSAVRFVMDPLEQLAAFEWIDVHDMELLGIFHSHPTGPETVSPTDIAEAAYAVIYIILSRPEGDWRARGFWIENGAFEDAALSIETISW